MQTNKANYAKRRLSDIIQTQLLWTGVYAISLALKQWNQNTKKSPKSLNHVIFRISFLLHFTYTHCIFSCFKRIPLICSYNSPLPLAHFTQPLNSCRQAQTHNSSELRFSVRCFLFLWPIWLNDSGKKTKQTKYTEETNRKCHITKQKQIKQTANQNK